MLFHNLRLLAPVFVVMAAMPEKVPCDLQRPIGLVQTAADVGDR
jgi:hypothetical protein